MPADSTPLKLTRAHLKIIEGAADIMGNPARPGDKGIRASDSGDHNLSAL